MLTSNMPSGRLRSPHQPNENTAQTFNSTFYRLLKPIMRLNLWQLLNTTACTLRACLLRPKVAGVIKLAFQQASDPPKKIDRWLFNPNAERHGRADRALDAARTSLDQQLWHITVLKQKCKPGVYCQTREQKIAYIRSHCRKYLSSRRHL